MGFAEADYWCTPHRYKNQLHIRNREAPRLVTGSEPGHMTANFERYISSGEGPFLAWLNPGSPHMPLWETMPEAFRTRYGPEDITLRGNVPQPLPYDPFWFKTYRVERYIIHRAEDPEFREEDFPLPEGFDLRSLTALYWGAVAYCDWILGNILAVLDRTGHREDTLVILTSDHGDNLGSHGLFNKEHLTEESIRIPFLMRWPGQIAPGEVEGNRMAQLVDVLPTVLAAAGLPIPSYAQGVSLFAPEQPAAFIDTPTGEVGIRTADYLYGYRNGDGKRWLFDLGHDPLELHNLAGTHAAASVEESLRERLARWEAATPQLCNLHK